VYIAHVQSVLQYGILAWGGALTSVIYPLTITQKSIMKSALKKPIRFPTFRLFESFPVLDIRQLFIKSLVIFGFKKNFSMLGTLTHSYQTRYMHNIGTVTPRIAKSSNASNPLYLLHVLYQNIPGDLRGDDVTSVAAYKRKVVSWLISIGRETANTVICPVYSV
jgi:hypothetical protein